MKCPKCVGKLQKKEINISATSSVEELKGAAVTQKLEIDQCFSCGGVWFDKGELEKYNAERITIIDSPSLGKELDSELDSKAGKCPRCEAELTKEPYEKESSITIDTCEKCGGIWLDSTEIDRIERLNKPKPGFFELIVRGFKKPE